MTMKACHECGAQVSTQASACPSCGAPVRTRMSAVRKIGRAIWLTAAGLVIVLTAWVAFGLGSALDRLG